MVLWCCSIHSIIYGIFISNYSLFFSQFDIVLQAIIAITKSPLLVLKRWGASCSRLPRRLHLHSYYQ